MIGKSKELLLLLVIFNSVHICTPAACPGQCICLPTAGNPTILICQQLILAFTKPVYNEKTVVTLEITASFLPVIGVPNNIMGNNAGGTDLSQFTSLASLSITGSQVESVLLSSFRSNLFLTFIDLSDNHIINWVNNVFTSHGLVTTLKLANNRLTSLPVNTFNGLGLLTELDLSGNKLTSLPATIFSPTPSLQTLYLQNNLLMTGPISLPITSLTSLQTLDMSNNIVVGGATTLPSTLFSGHNSLVYVGISNNGLTTLASNAFSNPLLSTVDVSNNNFPSSLDVSWLSNTPSIVNLTISGNSNLNLLTASSNPNPPNITYLNLGTDPLWCLCSEEWLQTMARKAISNAGSVQATCADPSMYVNQQLINVNLCYLNTPTINVPSSITCVNDVGGFTCAVFVGQSVTLTCSDTASPGPNMWWTDQYGSTVSSSPVSSNPLVLTNQVVYTINPVTLASYGVYTCYADSSKYSARSSTVGLVVALTTVAGPSPTTTPTTTPLPTTTTMTTTVAATTMTTTTETTSSQETTTLALITNTEMLTTETNQTTVEPASFMPSMVLDPLFWSLVVVVPLAVVTTSGIAVMIAWRRKEKR